MGTAVNVRVYYTWILGAGEYSGLRLRDDGELPSCAGDCCRFYPSSIYGNKSLYGSTGSLSRSRPTTR